MLRIFLFLSFFITQLSLTFGQEDEAMIIGRADSSYLSETRTIYAYTYDDYISYREKQLSKSPLDPKGNFILVAPATRPTSIFILIDNAKAEMTVEPGKQYKIMVLPKDSDAVNTLNSTNPVEISFLQSDDKELNFLLADFTQRYETMLEDYQGSIARKEPAIFKKIDTLETLFKKKYAAYKNPYLNTHIYYTFASLEESMALENKEALYKKHIEEKPVLLNNHSYMTFFHQFYSVTANYFMSQSNTITEINNKQNYTSLVELFKQSKLLANDTICEAVILKSLSEYFRYPDYKPSAILALLDQASTQCKAEENRRAAVNLKRRLSVMVVGKPAPSMQFLDMEGKSVSLADLKGKYVYLNFWATWCSSCTQDMTLIPELKKIYGGKIIFVSIAVDKKQETVKNFLKKNPKLSSEKNGAGWVFLYSDNYKKVKEEFKVLTVPTYYLIDPKGNVMKSPALSPADTEQDFNVIKNRR